MQDEEGIRVVRVPSYANANSHVIHRLRESASFGRAVRRFIARQPSQPDVVYANTWPMASQLQIARHCVKEDIPLVWHIQDVYPESLLTKLSLPARTAVEKPLMVADRWLVNQAKRTVVLSENMRRQYEETRTLPAYRLATVPNWVDETPFLPRVDRAEVCRQYGVDPLPFTFLFLGNIGVLAGVEFLIEAFAEAPPSSDLQLVIVGEGSRKRDCQELANRLGGDRIKFISDPDVANVPRLLQLGQVCLLPLKKGHGYSSVPSKLMGYMLSGKPVLSTLDADCDTANIIEEAKCGWVGPPEDSDWLTHEMVRVSRVASTELEQIGHGGREFGFEWFSRASGVKRLADLVIEAAN